ncbi:MAG TPA: hypothetical protein VFC00_11770 [Micromonosporaceae bacterium]|nr:hypothetical protein [Micromonosporaceae bacterium]
MSPSRIAAFNAALSVARIRCTVAPERGLPPGVRPAAISANTAVSCRLVSSASRTVPTAGIRYASTCWVYTRNVVGRMLRRPVSQYRNHRAVVQVCPVRSSRDCERTSSRARRAAAFEANPPRRSTSRLPHRSRVEQRKCQRP